MEICITISQRIAFNFILRLPPGTKEIEIGVDNDGFIFLSFEAPDSTDKDVFKWSTNYGKAIDAGRARLESKNNRSGSFGSGSVFLIYFLQQSLSKESETMSQPWQRTHCDLKQNSTWTK